METKIKLTLLAYAFYLLAYVTSHYHSHNGDYTNSGQDYEYEESPDYEPEHYPRHHSRRAYNNRGYSNSGRKVQEYQEDLQNDCTDEIGECSCDNCENPKPCCVAFCAACPYMPGQPNFMPYPYPYMQYPYPMVFPEVKNISEPTQATETTTTKSTTTISIPVTTQHMNNVTKDSDDIHKLAAIMKDGGNRYLMTSLRRMKPTNWVPKYGILPLPNNLAEKLMSQLREVKGLNGKYRQK